MEVAISFGFEYRLQDISIVSMQHSYAFSCIDVPHSVEEKNFCVKQLYNTVR